MNEKKPTGRPRLSSEEGTVSINATIKESQFLHLKEVGNGNVSKGVRIVTDAHQGLCLWCPECIMWVSPEGEWGEGVPAFCPYCGMELQY